MSKTIQAPANGRNRKLAVLDLFSGIGGFSLGLERATSDGEFTGFETVAFCEIEEFPRRVLAKHWPDVPCYRDVRELTAERLAADGIAVDVICGGFPCQDISSAGFGAGLAGERSGLFYEIARIARELGAISQRPVLILENVSALLSRGLDEVLRTLAALGYDAEWHCIPASALGAPHQRDRIWIVAYPNEDGLQEREHVTGACVQAPSSEQSRGSVDRVPAPAGASYTHARQLALGRSLGRMGWLIKSLPRDRNWPVAAEPVLGRGADGIPYRVDRCGALGNAVVPQIPELIGNAILAGLEREAA